MTANVGGWRSSTPEMYRTHDADGRFRTWPRWSAADLHGAAAFGEPCVRADKRLD